jgi:hypothetical protein
VSEIDDPILSGDSVAIEVTFKSGRYHRLVRKTTKVHTNDPETPVQHLGISAYVVKDKDDTGGVTVKPRKLAWKTHKGSAEEAAGAVSIVNGRPDSLRVIVLHAPEEVVTGVDLPSVDIAPEERADIRLLISEDAALAGTKALSATLAFIGRDTTVVTIPIEIEE